MVGAPDAFPHHGTRAWSAGEGTLRRVCASLIAESRLLMVPTLVPWRAEPARYCDTAAGSAGIESKL